MREQADLLRLAPQLISPLCGIVCDFQRVHKDPSEPSAPYIYHAELANHLFRAGSDHIPLSCSGKGFTPEAAQVSALGEAVERYGASCFPKDGIHYSSRDQLRGESLDPQDLVLFSPEQYCWLPYSPFSPSKTIGWVRGQRWGCEEVVWIPAIGALLAYEIQNSDECLFSQSSNGLAAGSSLPDALLSALCEVVERDAFLTTWMHKLPAERIDPGNHPDQDVRGLCLSYARRGVNLELYKLAVDQPVHVFLGLAVQEQGQGPAAVVGLGANLSMSQAARSALLEVGQIRPALRIRMREASEDMARLAADPTQVKTLQDHDLLYANTSMLHAFGFLRDSPLQSLAWNEPVPESTVERLARLAAVFDAMGCPLHYVDLTPRDLACYGLCVVRAILPGFQPIHFGYGEERLGGVRLFSAPERLGLAPRGSSRSPADLNPLPHPLS